MQRPLALQCIVSIVALTVPNVYAWADIVDPRSDPSLYNIGVGIYDITGPAAGVNLVCFYYLNMLSFS